MRQVIQNIGTGETVLAEVGVPKTKSGTLTVRTTTSLISAGTERMLIDFGRANWLDKARQQPDKVKEVIAKAKTDGLAATVETVRSKLDQPVSLGYSNAGIVVEVGDGVNNFKPGDRVVSNGPHAEVVNVPLNLCARIPDGIEFEAAVYTVPAAIALQGIRLAQPTLGESFAVTGLGLIGQLTVQLLIANGCRVLGIDPDGAKRELVGKFGAETVDPGNDDVLAAAARFSRSRGIDGVIVTAATRSDEPVSQAARMSRKRGRIVLVGVSGLNLSRADFYEKELSFQVSCSYGPGRYDPAYEQQGHDYPVGFVRWTEQRNFEAVLDMMSQRALDTAALTTHRYPIDRALDAYGLLQGAEPYLGIVLEYPQQAAGASDAGRTIDLKPEAVPASRETTAAKPSVAFIGAGNYAGRVLMPAFKAAGVDLRWVAANSGVAPAHYGKKFGFRHAGTDVQAAIDDPGVNTIVVATRHDSHADLVCRALEAGKHLFVEKPLALTLGELDDIESVYRSRRVKGEAPVLMVGFNRRFAPLTVKAKALLAGIDNSKAFVVTINAGAIPRDHWTQDRSSGGGRIVGEACHFVDLLRHLAGSRIVSAVRRSLTDSGKTEDDVASLHLDFGDGSIGTIHYLANGHRSFPKERIEIFSGGGVLQLDNFRVLRGWGWPGFHRQRLWRQDKGQTGCVDAFVRCIENGDAQAPVPFEELMEVSRASVRLALDEN